MAFPLLKLMDVTGSLGLPETVVLVQVLQAGGGGGRVRMGRLTMDEMTNSSEICLCSTIKHSEHLKTRFSSELS
jgi:hypothetical protein